MKCVARANAACRTNQIHIWTRGCKVMAAESLQPCHHHSSKTCAAGATAKLLQITLRHNKVSMPIACLVELLQGHQHGHFCSGNACTCSWWTSQTRACSTCELNPASWDNIVGSNWVVMQPSAARELLLCSVIYHELLSEDTSSTHCCVCCHLQ